MSTDDAVTVVIPTHNRRDLLLRTVDSVIRQRNVEVRVIVVDDGSTDDTAEKIEAFTSGDVELVRHATSQGVSAARNAGLDRVSTPWVAFVDDDDIWAPDKLDKQINALAQHPPAEWSCVGAIHIDAAVDVVGYAQPAESGDVSSLLTTGNGIPGGGSGVLVSTRLGREVGGFDESISILADLDFYLRLSLRSPVASVSKPLLGYYTHIDSMYHNPEGIIQEFAYLEQKYSSWPGVRLNIDYPRWYLRLIKMSIRKGERRTAWRLLRMGCTASGPGRGLVPFTLGVARWAFRRPFLSGSIPDIYAEEVSEWTDRYRHGLHCEGPTD